MGTTSSQPSADQPPSRALHVLRVIPGSPADLAGIQVFFDFIVGIEGREAKSAVDAQNLESIVESHEGVSLHLAVWSSKSRTMRTVTIIPSRKWALESGASTNANAQPSLLGISMRMCEPENALEHVWHILEILEGSPAESAGLVPYGDWIVGWSGGALSKEGDFYDIVEQHEEKPLRVYVYSYDFDTLREVVLVPNRMWGGEGLLGCGVGYGLLHRIPVVSPEQETNISINAEEDDDQETGSFEAVSRQSIDGARRESLFVPADVYPEFDASSAINGRRVYPDELDLSASPASPNPPSRPFSSSSLPPSAPSLAHPPLSKLPPIQPAPVMQTTDSQQTIVRSGAPSPPPNLDPDPIEATRPPAAATPFTPIPISAPVPQKVPVPLDLSASPPNSRTPPTVHRTEQHGRRSSTPDTLKQMISPRIDDFGIRRIGSPRLGFGVGSAFGGKAFNYGAQQHQHQSSTPSTPTRSSPSAPSRSTPPTKAKVSDGEEGDLSEGETLGGSITSVD